MNYSPSRVGATFLILAVGLTPGTIVRGQSPEAALAATPAMAVGTRHDGSAAGSVPVASSQPANGDIAHTDTKGRRLAAHGTFYLLDYVSATTDKGVEGFEPGQEVQLVEVHRPTHTLVVSDGRAQVEVSPSKLTNDMEIAALVRLKDQTNQARIVAYTQSEEAAYAKFEREAADATAKDLQQHEKEQAAGTAVSSGPLDAAQPTPAQVDATVVGNTSGYYGYGNEGYGSPYSYFSGDTVVVAPAVRPAAPATAPAAPAASSSKVAAPAHPAAGRAK